MRVIFSDKTDIGWYMAIQTPHVDTDGEPIVIEESFPIIDKVEMSGGGTPLHFDQGTVRDYGEMKVTGFVRQMPKMKPVYDTSTYHYAVQTGRSREKIRDEVALDYRGKPQFMKMDGMYERKLTQAQKTLFLSELKLAKSDKEKAEITRKFKGKKIPLSKNYPKQYVMTKDGWVPRLHLAWLAEIEEIIKIGNETMDSRELTGSLKQAKTPEEKLQVLKDNTISFPKRTRKERRAERPISMIKKPKGVSVETKADKRASTWSYEPKYCTKDKMGPVVKIEWKWKVKRMFRAGKLTESQIKVARKMGYLDEVEAAA